jgi:hypothetical protein
MVGNAKPKANNRKQSNGNGMRPVSAPAAKATPTQKKSAIFSPASSGGGSGGSIGTRVRQREFLGTINGSTGFVARRYYCNPGLEATFPLLSRTAQQWETYRFRSLKFEFLTRAPSSAVGSIIAAPDYDPTDVTPASEAIVTSYQNAVETVSWQNLTCVLDQKSMHELGERKFIRDEMVSGDLKLYDVAAFYLCTTEQADTAAVGKLWVEYDVELFNPSLDSNDSLELPSNTLFVQMIDQTVSTGVVTTCLFPTIDANSAGATFDVTGKDFVLPAGIWRVTCVVNVDDSQGNEAFTSIIQYYKAGVIQSPVSRFAGNTGAAGTSTKGCMVLDFIDYLNGTEHINIAATLVGAAGTLKCKVGSSLIAVPA